MWDIIARMFPPHLKCQFMIESSNSYSMVQAFFYNLMSTGQTPSAEEDRTRQPKAPEHPRVDLDLKKFCHKYIIWDWAFIWTPNLR